MSDQTFGYSSRNIEIREGTQILFLHDLNELNLAFHEE